MIVNCSLPGRRPLSPRGNQHRSSLWLWNYRTLWGWNTWPGLSAEQRPSEVKEKPYLMAGMQCLNYRGNFREVISLFKMAHFWLMMMGSVSGFSPFSSRYPQPVTAMVDSAGRPKALGGRQTGLRLTRRQRQCIHFEHFISICFWHSFGNLNVKSKFWLDYTGWFDPTLRVGCLANTPLEGKSKAYWMSFLSLIRPVQV